MPVLDLLLSRSIRFLVLQATLTLALLTSCDRGTWEPSPLPWPEAPVDEITVHRAAGTLQLSRSSGTWRLVEPINAPVSDELAARLSALLAAPVDVDLRRERRLTGEALEIESTDLRVVFGPGPNAWEGLIGRSGRRVSHVPTTWLAVGEGDTVYRARADVRVLFDRPPEAFRSLRVLSLERDAVHTVTLIDRESAFVVQREGSSWQAQDGTPIDEAAVRRLVLSLAHLRAGAIADVSLADAGLMAPQFAVRLTSDDEVATIYLGHRTEGNTWYAQREGDPTVFELSRVASRFVGMRQADLATPYAVQIVPDQVTRIRGAREWTRGECDTACEAGEPRQYSPSDGQPVQQEETQALRASLQATASLRVVRWLEAPAPAEYAAQLSRLTLERESGEPILLEIGPRIGDDATPLDPDDHRARLNHTRWFRISQRHAAPILALAAPPTSSDDAPTLPQTAPTE
ncbi:MAG: hypothetical protein ACJA1R_000098 [Flavobacteriales bacterium]